MPDTEARTQCRRQKRALRICFPIGYLWSLGTLVIYGFPAFDKMSTKVIIVVSHAIGMAVLFFALERFIEWSCRDEGESNALGDDV
jgi:hypothetical protein